MNRNVLALVLVMVVLAAAAAVGQTSAPAITQLFGFPCDSTLTICLEGSFPSGLIESPDGNFYGITD
jgi:hypothetical protein